MDWLQFIAGFIFHLSWPNTVGVLIFVLRKPILELIPALSKLRLKEFELEFRDRLADAQTSVALLANEKAKEDVVLLKPVSYYRDLARISPRAALMEVWMEVEAAHRRLHVGQFISGAPRKVRTIGRSRTGPLRAF